MIPPIIRPAAPEDNLRIATIIRTVMPEFGAEGPGFAIMDPEVDRMFESYSEPRHRLYVVEGEGQVKGCGGIAPLLGGDPNVCELRKMYMLPQIRGLGVGQKLLLKCLEAAKIEGYETCYLETCSAMTGAIHLYEKNHFTRLNQPRGATGHHGCDVWFSRSL